jgi:hypothetical protein
MLAISSPRNGYPILRVSYTAVTTECDASDRVAAPASQRDVAVGGPPDERRQTVAGGRHRARLLVLLGLVLGRDDRGAGGVAGLPGTACPAGSRASRRFRADSSQHFGRRDREVP